MNSTLSCTQIGKEGLQRLFRNSHHRASPFYNTLPIDSRQNAKRKHPHTKDGVVYEPAADTFNRDITEVLEEIMEVGKRPIEVEDAMQRFRNAAMHREKESGAESY